MYDPNLYDVDSHNRSRGSARLLDQALLFRLTTTTRCDFTQILNGCGGLNTEGRYHEFQQTTYCASNALLCIAEVLFHMYRKFINGIGEIAPFEHQLSTRSSERMLVIFKVKRIDDLVYADSEGCRVDYNEPRLGATTVVYPDPTYTPIREFALKLRRSARSGVVFPSARHSRDLAFAFFGDISAKVDPTTYELLPVVLKLIGEEQAFSVPPSEISLIKDKLHPTMGYYEFVDIDALERVREQQLLNPLSLAPRGYVDFVRRNYREYPSDACIWRGAR